MLSLGEGRPMLTKANLHISQHPLVQHRLIALRDRSTPPPEFRRAVRELAQMLFFEATRDLHLVPVTVTTPLAECTAQRLSERLGLVPILRAGLGMAEAIADMIPDVQIWHLGLYRDHQTLKPITYYSKLSGPAQLDVCFVVDPMLATGGSAVAAVTLLKEWGVRRLRLLTLIAAPEGVRALDRAHPDVDIHLAALDTHLDERSYIVPGLGDAGDRQFGTQSE
jgi:uracil phosphoribosyltransferase